MGEVKRSGNLVRASFAKGMEEKEGRFISGVKSTFPLRLAWRLKLHLQHPCCFQAEQLYLQDGYKCKLSWQSCHSAVYLKHLLHISCYSQVHGSARMQHLFSVSLEDRNYSWQGGASSIQEVVGAKQCGRTHFLSPFKLSGWRAPEVSNLVSWPWGALACLEEFMGSTLSPGRAQQHLTGRLKQQRCSWSVAGTQHEWI